MEWVKTVGGYWLLGMATGLVIGFLLRAAGLDINPGVSLGGAGGIGVVFGLMRLVTRRKKAAEEALDKLVPNPRLRDDMANCFGLGSLGSKQVRGTGCLALGEGGLVFVMWSPQKTLSIPADKLRSAEKTKSHAGKATSAPLVRIHFTDVDGKEDSVAFVVRDVDGWLSALPPAT